jgi:hypothetical protein
LKINLHRSHQNCDTVEHSNRKTRVNVQRCIGFRVCFGMSDVVLFKSRDIEIHQDSASMLNTWGTDDGGVGGKKRYIYSGSCDLIHILRFVG